MVPIEWLECLSVHGDTVEQRTLDLFQTVAADSFLPHCAATLIAILIIVTQHLLWCLVLLLE